MRDEMGDEMEMSPGGRLFFRVVFFKIGGSRGVLGFVVHLRSMEREEAKKR